MIDRKKLAALEGVDETDIAAEAGAAPAEALTTETPEAFEPESEWDTPERRATRAKNKERAAKERAFREAELARWGTDRSRRDAEQTRSGGGIQIIGTGYAAGALIYARARRVF